MLQSIYEEYSQRSYVIMVEDNIITELNGEITELTEYEIEFLLEFRMSNSEEQETIQELVEKANHG